MKILIFIVLFVSFFSFDHAFGTYQTELGDDDVFIFVQSTVRNSDGVLVAYLESTKFTTINITALESFLDFETSDNDPIITIDANEFQVIRRVQSYSFNSEELVASTNLFDIVDENPILLARFAHDGYSVMPGDVLTSIWTFVRSIS